MSDRKPMSKKTRFEVFKRDSFTCQYCGAKAPDAVLQVDHIEPVAKGGSDAMINLVTSCVGCNGGKSDTRLDDTSAVEKQRKQLDLLQQRREQVDMMIEWQKGLQNVDDYATEQVAEYWHGLCPGWTLNDSGKQKLRRLLAKHGMDVVMRSMREASMQVVLVGEPQVATDESQQQAWETVAKIARVSALYAEKPHMRRLFWIRGILRNKFTYCDEANALRILEEAYDAGLSLEQLERIAKSHRSWTSWEHAMQQAVEET